MNKDYKNGETQHQHWNDLYLLYHARAGKYGVPGRRLNTLAISHNRLLNSQNRTVTSLSQEIERVC